MELQGRHVVVTGGASGIGRALARRFATEGAGAVVVSDLDAEGAQAVADEVGGLAVRADVGREADIAALVARAEAAHGPIDLFCSNAGIAGPIGGVDIPDDAWQQLWRVNVMSHVWAARALLPGMLARREGYLLNTASAAGLLVSLDSIGYTATKHAAVAVAEWLSITYGDAGIGVSCLCPQFVRTPMLLEQVAPEVGAAALETVSDVIEPEQVADAVVAGIREERFLILPHAEVATYMERRGSDHARWLAGMRRLQGRLGGLHSARDRQAGGR